MESKGCHRLIRLSTAGDTRGSVLIQKVADDHWRESAFRTLGCGGKRSATPLCWARASQKRCRRCALPPHSKLGFYPVLTPA